MPVEIRELVLRATIIKEAAQTGDSGSSNSQEEIVAACTEQVLQILKRKQER